MSSHESDDNDETIEVRSGRLRSMGKRRVVIDIALVGLILACAGTYYDLREQVKTSRTSFEAYDKKLPELTARVERIEERERQTTDKVATKEDVRRVEAQLTELRVLLLNGPRR